MQTVVCFKKSPFSNFPPLFEGRSGKITELQTVVEKCTVCIIYANISLFSPNSNIALFSKSCMYVQKRRQKTARQLIFYIIYIYIPYTRERRYNIYIYLWNRTVLLSSVFLIYDKNDYFWTYIYIYMPIFEDKNDSV